MSEQIIVNSPDSKTSLLLKELLKKMNIPFTSKDNEDVISEEEKSIVMDRLKNTKEENDLDWKDVKKMMTKK